MPVFGKGRTQRQIIWRQMPEKELKRTLTTLIENGKKPKRIARRVFVKKQKWVFEKNNLGTISYHLRVNVSDWVKERFVKTEQPVVAVEWGCGTGQAITELAEQNPGIVHCYGFSKDSYSAWKRNPLVKFIQEQAQNLPRYLKNNSVDIIFSDLGLEHYWVDCILDREEEKFGEHIAKLFDKLKSGGMIITTIWYPDKTKEVALLGFLEAKGLNASIIPNRAGDSNLDVFCLKKP